MGKYNKMTSKLESNSNKPAAESVSKCMYQGCPINAASLDSDGYSCIFHDTKDYSAQTTEAIRANLHFITAYNKMQRWGSEEWQSQGNWLMTNVNIPMKKDEVATVYLNRYFSWLNSKIKDEATEIAKGIAA